MKIVLFDVDGVLVKHGIPTHMEAFSVAIERVFGVKSRISEVEHAGKTDMKIIIDLMKFKGMKEDEIRPKLKEVFKIMVDYVNGHVDELKVKSPDGVQELVVELKKKNFVLGLVTGNLKEIARVKLEKIGLWGYFEIGGFGEVSDVRSELVEEALKQVKSAFERENVFYIGDTPLDIECGKEAGVNTIVVATKRFSFEELQKHNPDLILKNLSDYQQILNLVGD